MNQSPRGTDAVPLDFVLSKPERYQGPGCSLLEGTLVRGSKPVCALRPQPAQPLFYATCLRTEYLQVQLVPFSLPGTIWDGRRVGNGAKETGLVHSTVQVLQVDNNDDGCMWVMLGPTSSTSWKHSHLNKCLAAQVVEGKKERRTNVRYYYVVARHACTNIPRFNCYLSTYSGANSSE